MCLAVPGELIALEDDPSGLPFGRVRFGTVTKRVCMAYVPDATPGEFVIVHVGFALQRLDRQAAESVLAAYDSPDLGPAASGPVDQDQAQ